MKTKLLCMSLMLISVVGFAQKDAIKKAEKALKSGSVTEAKSALEGVSTVEEKYKSKYHLLKGKVYYDMAKKDLETLSSYKSAVEAFKEVVDYEKQTGKKKYSADAETNLQNISASLANSANDDFQAKKYGGAKEKLYLSYNLDNSNQDFLYFAATSAVLEKDYEAALKYYEELKTIGYEGIKTTYTATNTATGESEELSAQQYDLFKKSKSYTDFEEKKSESKRPEIIKNIALIYLEQGHDEKAQNAFVEARAAFPDDVNLIISEAQLFLKMGDKDKFKELMAVASTKDPNNPDLQYNIGVVNMEEGDFAAARDAYNKALKIKPDYVNAILNLSTTYVNESNALIDKMNELSTSNKRADIEKYDALKAKKDDLLKQAAVALENGLTSNSGNSSLLGQLKNIYGVLGDTDNYLRVKKMLE